MSDIEVRMVALRQRFVASAAQQASALRTALQANDSERAREIAHHLAGASGIFGHPDLGELARCLEEAIEAETSGRPIEPLATDVLAALDRLPGQG